MLDLPRRRSLSAQTAEAIQKAIHDGTWHEYLPSERRLCELFQVSRPTVRTALHMLKKEGLLDIRQGRRNRLLSNGAKPSGVESRLIGLLTSEPVSAMSLAAYQGISEMRTQLAAHGFATEILVCRSTSITSQRRLLQSFVKRHRALCCVLMSVSKEIQEWFAERSLPALVLGSCHPTVNLPSLDTDYRSVCRHAAGVFLAKGHRHLVLLAPNSGAAGDLASEEGFREAVVPHHATDVTATVVRHNGTAANLAAKLDALFDSPHPPTALLVAKPQHVFMVVIYLLERGLTVPGQVSLIARDFDPMFASVRPAIAHYTFQLEAFERRLSRLVLQLINNAAIPAEPNLVFPKFFPGGSIRSLP